jgi:hypothetical protein
VLSSRASLLVSASFGLFAGVGYPCVDVALACKEAVSEACVWGKAYFPLTLGLSLIFIGGGSAAFVYAALAYWRRTRRGNHSA